MIEQVNNTIACGETVAEHTSCVVHCLLLYFFKSLAHQIVMVFKRWRTRRIRVAGKNLHNTLLRLGDHIAIRIKPSQHIKIVGCTGIGHNSLFATAVNKACGVNHILKLRNNLF